MNDEDSKANKNFLKLSSDTNYKEMTWNEDEKKFTSNKKPEDCSNEKDSFSPIDLRKKVEPWLTALFQSERLNLLVGSGLTLSQENLATGQVTDFMECMNFSKINKAVIKIAEQNGRKKPNIEDQINVANALLEGLYICATENDNPENLRKNIEKLRDEINENLVAFIKQILSVEKKILENQEKTQRYLIPFLMSFAGRTSSKERLHIFTTNYDRVIEWGAEMTGLRLIDRFVGSIEPVFRASRLNIDMHYNPPGIRGEPRYLEGVAYFTKLHGSLDWSYKNKRIQRIALPFGKNEYKLPSAEQCLIYPNSAKDQQTTFYPYSELFRDFATAICRPNTTLVTYGYGFGDTHINKVIEDMLTIPSTHLVIISYDANSQVCPFYKNQDSKKEQISMLIGPQLADITNLVKYYLPKSAIDKSMNRMLEIQKQRGQLNPETSQESTQELEEVK